MFTKLKFTNFRGFGSLDLEGLQRVNLIVGPNNAGKTSLLEGLVILAAPDQMAAMPGMFRPVEGDPNSRYFPWLLRDHEGAKSAELTGETEIWSNSGSFCHGNITNPGPGLVRAWGNGSFSLIVPQERHRISFRIVSVQPRTTGEIVNLFAAAVTRRGGEELMDDLVRKIDNRIRKIRVIPFNDGLHVMADLNFSEMMPISQLGQGVHRLITIFSELVSGDAKLCIIDEIENGIYHSMLEQVWTGIAAAAESLDLQVFATTHSYECIVTAHTAFSKRSPYDFSIVQLFRVDGGPQGRVLDQKHIEAAMAGEIDLR